MPDSAPALSAPPTSGAGQPSFGPLTRARSTSSAHWNDALAPAMSAHDLPESTTMAGLERTTSAGATSIRSLRSLRGAGGGGRGYGGGEGLGKSTTGRSRRSGRGPIVVGEGEGGRGGKTERIEEEEIAVGEHGEAIEETLTHAEMMYRRFSESRKKGIVAMVSFAALLAPFSSSSFLPSIPQIVDELNTTSTIINVTVAIFILVIGIFPLVWAPYAGVYGRRPIYIISLPIFALGSLGVALCDSLASLIVTRIIQGIGSCSVLSVGAGTIGDLYPRERRGKAMGLFYLGILVGPATAPAIAGILTEYAHPEGQGWRAMQWLLFAMGVLASAIILFFFPETAHARGIDVIRAQHLAARAEKLGVDPEKLEEQEEAEVEKLGRLRRMWARLDPWVWMNPLAPLKLLLHPNILGMSVTSSFVLMSTYTVLVPLSSTVAPRYNITNAAILGCFYLSQGVGNAVASRYTGMWADWTLKHWLKKRNGVYVPEDRLKATLIGAGLVLPGSVLALGWVLDRVGGKVGLAWTIVLLFVDGVGLMCILTPLNTYGVDLMPVRSSEVIAVNNACRYIISAAASAFVLPMIQAIGVGWTNTFAALLVWAGFGIILFLIRFGRQMRLLGERWEGTAATGTDIKRDEEEQGEKAVKREDTVGGSADSGAASTVVGGEEGREEAQKADGGKV
ncbi:hypothetical protein JCM8097_002911 [Rhodosporidiobolus ruineniae]